ncbi:MAG: protein translocase subunit SecF [Deltaproteobacteria bacterium]|nr:protein translocase subunit SecF [Deltaproteobacteria bacterium]
MEFFKPGLNFDFVGKMKLVFVASMCAVAISIISLVVHGGPLYGIDFAGGTLVQVKFKNAISMSDIRDSLASINMEQSVIQRFGTVESNGYLIKSELSSSEIKGLATKIEGALAAKFGKDSFEVQRVEVVGPKVGADLQKKGLYAVVFACVGILIYIAIRFEFRYAVGAIIALAHDITIVVGIFSLLNKEFSLTIIAALLTILGYSNNDTIVVYDRIRENLKKTRRRSLAETMNTSINETLSRTVITSGVTALVVVALFFFGGAVIHDFAFALIIGIVVGTYSSIFIASPVVLAWESVWPPKQKRK